MEKTVEAIALQQKPGTVVGWTLTPAEAVPAHDDWLGPHERRVLAGLQFPPRRASWRLGRYSAKRLLGAYSGHAPETFEVRAAEDGAPEPFQNGARAPYSLSISHSGAYAFCSVAPANVALGCDLEAVAPRSEAFVADYFTPDEQALVTETPDALRARSVNLIWSAKESALKALRTGLRLDTRCVQVLAAPHDLRATSAARWRPLQVHYPDGARRFDGWWQSREGYVLTLVGHPSPLDPPVDFGI